ncbi:hypothetical protein EJ04DRAFT_525686 [Polyplosphaeria fusca]|uniref:Uncharacterized protein n=1 Tax=Polyplosphaeria fusca TaxID=682080 RepID=A0A9P4UZ50_9PLEO|nr:hypothetical protein EJ04DRAFT_525686 [Polyplosphaeria fusca]
MGNEQRIARRTKTGRVAALCYWLIMAGNQRGREDRGQRTREKDDKTTRTRWATTATRISSVYKCVRGKAGLCSPLTQQGKADPSYGTAHGRSNGGRNMTAQGQGSDTLNSATECRLIKQTVYADERRRAERARGRCYITSSTLPVSAARLRLA